MKDSFITLKKVFVAITICFIGMFGCCHTPARAGLDEFIRQDVSYFKLTPVGGGAEVESDKSTSYIVQRGDTLISVAKRFGLQTNIVADANNLRDEDFIEAGKVLLIPGTAQDHLIQPGETLTGIAHDYGVSLNSLVLANNLHDDDMLIAGQELVVPLSENNVLPAWNYTAGLPVNMLAWPVAGGWVSSGFGIRDGRPHEGIDIAAFEGDSIEAIRSGRVIFAGPRGTYGLTVIIDHGSGLTSLYGHTSAILVREGDSVKEGQIIARVGSTGRSTGPHLHLEVRLNGIPYDPLLCLVKAYA
ncbi:MAG TPA: peptidase M23 [Desulfotomaculum sp.]|nr:MAG: Peptidase M23 [Desulfotomaculum sp. 46_80]HAG11675.1 peptidase M23 [Desulfotomaculum sp.]HBY05053.1 peptidase M23 [Desulfotomaculum sp.]